MVTLFTLLRNYQNGTTGTFQSPSSFQISHPGFSFQAFSVSIGLLFPQLLLFAPGSSACSCGLSLFRKSSSMYPLHPERSRLDTQMSYTYQDSTNPKTFLAMPPGYPILPILIFSLITICYFYLEQLVNTIMVTYLLVC